MADFDVKIETFTNLTLTQAAKARDKILEKCENGKKTALDEYSKQCGEKFSKMLKENQTKISTENHRNVSKEITECKKAVFSHREMLIEKLFADLKGKIADYKKSSEYKDYLEKCAEKGISEIGGKNFTLTFDTSDKETGGEIAEKLNAKAEFKDGLIGGVTVSGDGNIACNMSFSSCIENLRETFLENSGFSIDVI